MKGFVVGHMAKNMENKSNTTHQSTCSDIKRITVATMLCMDKSVNASGTCA
jgi:hypothetical protein